MTCDQCALSLICLGLKDPQFLRCSTCGAMEVYEYDAKKAIYVVTDCCHTPRQTPRPFCLECQFKDMKPEMRAKEKFIRIPHETFIEWYSRYAEGVK